MVRVIEDEPRPLQQAAESGPVAFIGAGQMGAPMVRRLLAAGIGVTLHARRPEVQAEFAALGARTCAGLAEAVSGADIVISCLFNESQVAEVLLGPRGLVGLARPGSVLVSHTTIGPSLLTRIGQEAAVRGLGLLDAPVSGGPDDIDAGQLTVLAGGDAAVIERARPALSAYSNVVPTGALGTATRVKLINNLLYAVNAQTVAAAADLGRQLGIDPDALLAGVLRCSGASRAMATMAGVGSLEDFSRFALPYLSKDVAAALAAAAEAGADPGLLAGVAHDGPLPLTSH